MDKLSCSFGFALGLGGGSVERGDLNWLLDERKGSSSFLYMLVYCKGKNTKHKQSEAMGMPTEVEPWWKDGVYIALDFRTQKERESKIKSTKRLNDGCV